MGGGGTGDASSSSQSNASNEKTSSAFGQNMFFAGGLFASPVRARQRRASRDMDEGAGILQGGRHNNNHDDDGDNKNSVSSDEEEERRRMAVTAGPKKTRRWLRFFLISFCILVLCLTTIIFMESRHRASSTLTSPTKSPSSIPPVHPSYQILSSSFVQEHALFLHRYRHLQSGAEFLASMPVATASTATTTTTTSSSRAGEQKSLWQSIKQTSTTTKTNNNNNNNNEDYGDKVFAASFRTVPTDSTGVAHILEHSVLNGSRNYPSKDPFRYLLQSSLHTFLNAMTYGDRTVYPLASRNFKDFSNLIKVYLDAVFFPMAVDNNNGDWIFKQEGWRYELTQPGPGQTPPDQQKLEYKGVVYSEMKGAYSDPDNHLLRLSLEALYPDTTYRFDSGGDPRDIPNLTRKQFIDFYNQHYHPSNCQLFVSGGPKDVAESLLLVDGYLSQYQARPELRQRTTIPRQKLTYTSTQHIRRPYASSSPSEDGSYLMMSWLLHYRDLDAKTEVAFAVLEWLLLGTSSSVLYKALAESRLGTSVLNDGIAPDYRQWMFFVGMKGIQVHSDVVKVEQLIIDTLQQVADDGFPKEDIEAALNAVEFQLREFNTGKTPKGIMILLGILSKWNYDLDPVLALEFESALLDLKDRIATDNGSRIFQSLIRTYLLGNTHRVSVELYPSSTLEQEEVKEEEDRLTKIQNSLSPQQFQDIINDNKAFKQIQATDDPPEIISKIPTLQLKDLDRTTTEYPISVNNNYLNSDLTVITHTVPSSSGIVYIDFGLDISSLNVMEDIGILSFISRMFLKTGSIHLSDIELDRLIAQHTGGITMQPHIQSILPQSSKKKKNDDNNVVVVTEGQNLVSMMFIRAKCTAGKIAELFSIFNLILTEARLDSKEKAIQILEHLISETKSSVLAKGHQYANRRVGARYSVMGFLDEQISGVSSIHHLTNALKEANEDWPTFHQKLERIRYAMLRGPIKGGGWVLNLTGDSMALDAIRAAVTTFVKIQVPLLHTSGNDIGNNTVTNGNLRGSTTTPMEEEKEALPNFRAVAHPWYKQAIKSMKTTTPIRNEGIIITSSVSYVAKGGQIYDINEVVSGSALVVTRHIEKGYLWNTVRVKNGAYGVFADLSRSHGTFNMVSYRDPEVKKTLDAFDNAADVLLNQVTKNNNNALPKKNNNNENGSERKNENPSSESSSLSVVVKNAIIGTIGVLDGPTLPPDEVGWISLQRWYSGETAIARQQYRTEVLNTNVEDFVKFAERLKSWDNTSVTVVGSKAVIEKEADLIVIATV